MNCDACKNFELDFSDGSQQTIDLAYFSTAKIGDDGLFISHASYYLPAVQIAAGLSNEVLLNSPDGINSASYNLTITEYYTGYDDNATLGLPQNIGDAFKKFDDLMIPVPFFYEVPYMIILGPNTNVEAIHIPAFADGYQTVQIAHAVDSPEQSQTGRYPSFYRLSMPNTVYMKPTVYFLEQLPVNNLAVLVEGTVDGFPKKLADNIRAFIDDRRKTLNTTKMVYPFLSDLTFYGTDFSNITASLLNTYNTRYILLVTRTILGAKLVCGLSRNGITAEKGYVWIITRVTDWRTYYNATEISKDYDGCTDNVLNAGLAGGFIVETSHTDLSGALVLNKKKVPDIVSEIEKYKNDNYPGTSAVKGKWFKEAFDAVLVAAKALSAVEATISESINCHLYDYSHEPQLTWLRTIIYNELKKNIVATNFIGMGGKLGFDDNFDPIVRTSIFQFGDKGVANVRSVFSMPYNSNHLQSVNSLVWFWKDGTKPPPDKVEPIDYHLLIDGLAIGAAVIGLVAILATIKFFITWKRKRELLNLNWTIPEHDVTFSDVDGDGLHRANSLVNLAHIKMPQLKLPYQVVFVKAKRACLFAFRKALPDISSDKVLTEIKHMRDLRNEHIAVFFGCLLGSDEHDGFIMDFAGKECLEELISNPKLKFDVLFQYIMLRDIASGMDYLHNSPIKSHGRLRSTCIIVDRKFIPKITEHGLPSFQVNFVKIAHFDELLWCAPELLRDQNGGPMAGTQSGDSYSFGIIMGEVMFLMPAYSQERKLKSEQEIVNAVKQGTKPLMRPKVEKSKILSHVYKLMNNCLSENIKFRPRFHTIVNFIINIMKLEDLSSSNIMESLLVRMEKYATTLEDVVAQHTAAFDQIQDKTMSVHKNQLLTLQNDLTNAVPEFHKSITVSSYVLNTSNLDVKNFEIVKVLNEIQRSLRDIFSKHAVIKLDTVDSKFTVFSGTTTPTASNHANHIIRAALEVSGSFVQSSNQCSVSIGIHSGGAVVGVAGGEKPKICLFGEVLQISAAIAASGKENGVRCSDVARNSVINAEEEEFVFQSAGTISFKNLLLETFDTTANDQKKPKQ